jgi:hypothetical protein
LLVPSVLLRMRLSCEASEEGREPNWWARGEREKVCEKATEERVVDELRSVEDDDAGERSQSQASLLLTPTPTPAGSVLPLAVVGVVVVACIVCIVCIVDWCSTWGQGARETWWRGLVSWL